MCSLIKSLCIIIQSVLGFLKVVVARQPAEHLQHHLKSMVEGLLLWSDDSKNHFKAKVDFGLRTSFSPVIMGCWEVASIFFIFTMSVWYSWTGSSYIWNAGEKVRFASCFSRYTWPTFQTSHAHQEGKWHSTTKLCCSLLCYLERLLHLYWEVPFVL